MLLSVPETARRGLSQVHEQTGLALTTACLPRSGTTREPEEAVEVEGVPSQLTGDEEVPVQLRGWLKKNEEWRLVRELIEMQWVDRIDDRFVVLGRDRAVERLNLPRSARRQYLLWLRQTLTKLGIEFEIADHYCCFDGSGRNRCTAVRVDWTPRQLEMIDACLDSIPVQDSRPTVPRQSSHPILRKLNAGHEVLRQLIRMNSRKVLQRIGESEISAAQKRAAKLNVNALQQNSSHHYHFSRSGRLFTRHLSLQTLKNRSVGFRDQLLASPRTWKCDLVASQLAIFASKAQIPELDGLLEGVCPLVGEKVYDGPWEYFVANLGMPKHQCKTLVYSVLYGMDRGWLARQYGRAAVRNPMIQRMLDARERMLDAIDSDDRDSARSQMAIQAQRLERDIMRQVYDSLPEEVAVLADLHDGLYVHMPADALSAQEIMRYVNLWVNFYIDTLGLKTHLKWEAVPGPNFSPAA